MENNKILNDDKILVAAVIGAFSTLISEAVSRILHFMGFGKYTIFKLNSFIVTVSVPSDLVGLIVNFYIGSIIGVLIYVALKKWGHRYTIIMSCGVGIFMWFLWEALTTFYIEGKTIPLRPTSDYYVHLISTIAYGIFMGLMMKRFVFNKNYKES